MKLKTILGAFVVATAGLASMSANAALVQCFTSNSLVEQPPASCVSWGSVPTGPSLPVTQDAGVATTVGGSAGNFDLLSIAGTTPDDRSPDQVLGSSTSIQYSSGIVATDSYLVLIYETGNFPREWNVISVLGSALISGFQYAENIPTGTVKFEIYTDSRITPPTVSTPGTLALVGLGLAAMGLRRRRAA